MFLKDAPVLILGEPTSSVDAGTGAGIAEAMERLMRGRTTFIIAHRLSALKHCDILIRIEHGRVLSAGPAGMVAEKALAVNRPDHLWEETQCSRPHSMKTFLR